MPEMKGITMDDLTDILGTGSSSSDTGSEIAPPDTTCGECGFVAQDVRGLKAHLRSHQKIACEFCGNEFVANGIGGHMKYCEQNPNRVTSTTKRKIIIAEEDKTEAKPAPNPSGAAALAARHFDAEKMVREKKPLDVDLPYVLLALFPDGIPPHKYDQLSDWMEMTRQMISE